MTGIRPEIRFVSMPTEQARAYWAGGADANGQVPERHISDGDGVPCRHCLRGVAEGEPYLILAYRPFPEAQPYAEIGPIFLHAEPCERSPETAEIPAMFRCGEPRLLKGYGSDDRIVYGTGQIVPAGEVGTVAAQIFARDDVRYVHVRSALNNCYSCRINRA